MFTRYECCYIIKFLRGIAESQGLSSRGKHEDAQRKKTGIVLSGTTMKRLLFGVEIQTKALFNTA